MPTQHGYFSNRQMKRWAAKNEKTIFRDMKEWSINERASQDAMGSTQAPRLHVNDLLELVLVQTYSLTVTPLGVGKMSL